MKKKLFALTMAIVIVLTSSIVCYADSITPRDTNFIVFNTERLSRTKADVSIDVSFVQQVDRYSVVIYLQKRVNGEWVLDTTNDDYVFYNNGFRKRFFSFGHRYTDLEDGVSYRIKCVSKDYIGDSTYIFTGYSKTF